MLKLPLRRKKQPELLTCEILNERFLLISRIKLSIWQFKQKANIKQQIKSCNSVVKTNLKYVEPR